MERKKVLLIHTGGTIGMVTTSDGYDTQSGYMKTVLDSLDELKNQCMPLVTLLEMSPLLDSTNVSLRQWNEIGNIINSHYNEYDGFVVLHGTDTMAYTASALAFMLQNLGKPVVLTGSQIPFCEIRNDARDNLLTALLFASRDDINEVCLYFGGKLMRGVRSTKLSADALCAFDSPNDRPLASCGIEIKTFPDNLMPKPKAPLRYLPFAENSIAVLKVFPGINFGIYDNIFSGGLKGIVLEGFGAGNVPETSENGLEKFLERAEKTATAVVVVTQCLRGAAKPGFYAVSAGMKSHGVISGHDMTAEAAVTKLYALLSANLCGDELKTWMETPMCGELTR